MKQNKPSDDERQLAHFSGGGEVEFITLTEAEYSSLKETLAGFRKRPRRAPKGR